MKVIWKRLMIEIVDYIDYSCYIPHPEFVWIHKYEEHVGMHLSVLDNHIPCNISPLDGWNSSSDYCNAAGNPTNCCTCDHHNLLEWFQRSHPSFWWCSFRCSNYNLGSHLVCRLKTASVCTDLLPHIGSSSLEPSLFDTCCSWNCSSPHSSCWGMAHSS